MDRIRIDGPRARQAYGADDSNPRGPQEYDKYHGAIAADRFLDRQGAQGVVAAFNAGVYNYVMDRDVLNLDGVVNPEALRASQAGDLLGYLRRKGVAFLIEHDPDQAGTAARSLRDSRARLDLWVDLSEDYPPFGEEHAKRTYLWKVVLP